MTKTRLMLIAGISDALCKSEGKKLFWQVTKEQYQKLETDEEKNNILGHIFADTKKEA